ncbi:MAG: hypothetical protein OFPI_33520 [Osedax symbiont Rs2]|nr:MAG: hypothetical protein OFPI_33520 [Osedax symbiont Rs2]
MHLTETLYCLAGVTPLQKTILGKGFILLPVKRYAQLSLG